MEKQIFLSITILLLSLGIYTCVDGEKYKSLLVIWTAIPLAAAITILYRNMYGLISIFLFNLYE